MNFMNLNRPVNDKKLAAGQLLIAEPFLSDPNFARSVILLCEHGEEGSVGFMINKPTDLTLGDLLPDLYTPSLGVSQGGPVQLDTLHMLHRMPETFGGNEISSGVYWGGSYDALQQVISTQSYQPMNLRLFVGYSGWSPGQLEKEVEEGSWIIADLSPKILFETEPHDMWKAAIRMLGKEYAFLANMPVNPQLN